METFFYEKLASHRRSRSVLEEAGVPLSGRFSSTSLSSPWPGQRPSAEPSAVRDIASQSAKRVTVSLVAHDQSAKWAFFLLVDHDRSIERVIIWLVNHDQSAEKAPF